jgi:hypothetical protein
VRMILALVKLLSQLYLDHSEHSHPIGSENLAFTRKGRRLLNEQAVRPKSPQNNSAPTEMSTVPMSTVPPPAATFSNHPEPVHVISAPTSFSMPLHVSFPSQPLSTSAQSQHTITTAPLTSSHPMTLPPTSLTQMASLLNPSHLLNPQACSAFDGTENPGPSSESSTERWERLSALFQSVRDSGRAFTFSTPSLVALESVLVRMYLESSVVQAGALLGLPLASLSSGDNGLPPGNDEIRAADPQGRTAHTSGDTSS